MPLVAPVILPEMYKIFTMAEVCNLSSRITASKSCLGSGQPPHLVWETVIFAAIPTPKDQNGQRSESGLTLEPSHITAGASL